MARVLGYRERSTTNNTPLPSFALVCSETPASDSASRALRQYGHHGLEKTTTGCLRRIDSRQSCDAMSQPLLASSISCCGVLLLSLLLSLLLLSLLFVAAATASLFSVAFGLVFAFASAAPAASSPTSTSTFPTARMRISMPRCSLSHRSASIAAWAPEAAAVMACLYVLSVTSPAAKRPGTDVAVALSSSKGTPEPCMRVWIRPSWSMATPTIPVSCLSLSLLLWSLLWSLL
mmetsp:Transcript_4264/g.8822  ORF Transcript_4264/g.8822 Transcript_4264/m.8822 type:complete len:233 (+) Transcript_4264:632-1330(+)